MNRKWVTRRMTAMTVAILALVAVHMPAAHAVPPANDDFDSATAISALPFNETSLDTTEATFAADDPQTCSNNGSVWYAFTPAADMVVDVNTAGSNYFTAVAVYTGTRGALSQVGNACNTVRVNFTATAGTTYYVLVSACCGFGGNGGGDLVLSVQEILPPSNDNFANAIQIGTLPFQSALTDITGATVEASEPTSFLCGFVPERSIWYSFTPTVTESLSSVIFNASFGTIVAVYSGNALGNLTEVGCRTFGSPFAFRAEADTTYYFQVYGLFGGFGSLQFNLDVAPPPQANFSFFPNDPSVFDSVQFVDNSVDPAGAGIQSQAWSFGDGATATDCCPTHQYAADGDYTVDLTVTTVDRRTASTSQVIAVRTRDVAITRFAAPQAARVGQTRQISVDVSSKRYPEDIEVQLYKSVPGQIGGFSQFATLIQSVPVSKRGTAFKFSYTFTPEDGTIGKVTFKAIANIRTGRDALPADNEAISSPTKVAP